MPRGRRSSSASSDRPSRSRSQSRGARSKSRGPAARSQSHGPSRSKSRGPPLSRHHSSGADDTKPDHAHAHSGPGVKGSLLFLGTIAAAAFTAHKVWPKGMLYGHKDDWEHEHEKHEHEAKKSQRTQRQQPGRARDRDERSSRVVPPPRYRDAENDRAGYHQTTRPRRDAPPPPPPAAWSADRRRALESSARSSTTTTAPLPFGSDRQSQSTGSSSTGTSPRKYLPYEPGVYTPPSVATSTSSNARALFEQRRERPVLLPLPLERPRGYLPSSAPVAAPVRRNHVFEDEGYASRESVPPAARSFSSRYEGVDGVEYRR